MVDAGKSPTEAIRPATGVAVDCIGVSDLGILEPGRWADSSVLSADPTENSANTKTIESVYIAGNRVAD